MERTRLQYVNRERMLPVARRRGRLLAASYGLIVQHSRGDGDVGIVGELLLREPGAAPAAVVTTAAAADKPDELAGRLVAALDQRLAAAP